MGMSVPSEAISVYNIALDMSSRGDYHKALSEYSRAITIHPGFLEAYNNMGELYSKMGKSDLAISTYIQALAIERNFKVLLNLGVEYYNKGQYLPALSHFSESVKLNDDFIEGHFYSAMAFFNIKDYQNAEQHFLKVIKFDKKHVKANLLLSYIYYEWKRYADAIACLDRVPESAEDAEFINKYYGFCHYHLGDYEKAISYLTKAIESNPNYKRFHDYLKNLTYENKMKEIGDIDACIRELEAKFASQKPTMREHTRLSMLYVFKGEYRKAEEILVGYLQ
jgi:tetratricopeptide (TPR) repeat protein